MSRRPLGRVANKPKKSRLSGRLIFRSTICRRPLSRLLDLKDETEAGTYEQIAREIKAADADAAAQTSHGKWHSTKRSTIISSFIRERTNIDSNAQSRRA